jgi:hypothetical protein
MSAIERQQYLKIITQRLIIYTGSILLMTAIFLYLPNLFIAVEGTKSIEQIEKKKKTEETKLKVTEHSYLVVLVFAMGLTGGFVSIQQRLPKISVEELKVLSSSRLSIMLIPINGGIFALILMIMFLGRIVQGSLFPNFPSPNIGDIQDYKEWITTTYPATGSDVAKLLFWSFVAGFSERFVPQIIRRTSEEIDEKQKKDDK